jgi:hypothetical protein
MNRISILYYALAATFFTCSNSSAGDLEKRVETESQLVFSLINVKQYATSRCSIDADKQSSRVDYILAKKYKNLNAIGDVSSPDSMSPSIRSLYKLSDEDSISLCTRGEREVYLNEIERDYLPKEKNRISLQAHYFVQPIFNSAFTIAFVVEGDLACSWQIKAGQSRKSEGCEAGETLLVFKKKAGRWVHIATEELWIT